MKINKILNFLNPFSKVCPFCYNMQDNSDVCYECYAQLIFLKNACKKCQQPFDYILPDSDICQLCHDNNDNIIEQMRCSLVYNNYLKSLIINYKNGNELILKNIFAKIIYANAQDLLKNCIICPIPLSDEKLSKRGFNQCWYIAQCLQDMSGQEAVDILKRVKNTQSQENKSVKEREENMNGAFKVKNEYREYIKGKNVCLVDDVITTGSTMYSAAKELKKCGANVYLISLARRIKFIN